MAHRFFFVGNRRFVLEDMLRRGLDISVIAVVAGSHLERDLRAGVIGNPAAVAIIDSRQALMSLIAATPFDVLVSNGCPYILPIAALPPGRYVNIHPSCLPDLRGVDPVIGSILFQRDAGATCHVIDAGIDTGPIIAQVRIPHSDDLDVTTLYQLSFLAERAAFAQSLARDFAVESAQAPAGGEIYYSRRAEDRIISFREPVDEILRKVRAFNNPSQGCAFEAASGHYRVFQAQRPANSFLVAHVKTFPERVVALSYERDIVFRIGDDVLRFQGVTSLSDGIPAIGERLGAE